MNKTKATAQAICLTRDGNSNIIGLRLYKKRPQKGGATSGVPASLVPKLHLGTL
jgi:hypothetical protein